ncbi:MAG TPA: hypothetical protein VGE11_10465 [Pseudonocardia sp.]|jgi:hypothetical protein
MADRVRTSVESRAEAAAALLSGLEDLVVTYAGVPQDERQEVLAQEAERVTAAVAQLLQAARRKITSATLR